MSNISQLPDRTVRLDVYPPEGEALTIPKRRDNKRSASQAWDRKFSDLTSSEIENKRYALGKALNEARKKHKRQVSMDDEYWKRYLQIASIHKEQAQLESQRGLEKAINAKQDASTWYETEDAERFKLNHDSWGQFSATIEKHRQTLQLRLKSNRESFLRLFTISKIGLDLAQKQTQTGVGERESTLQSNFAQQMIDAYCPKRKLKVEGCRWDPVLHSWLDVDHYRAAHLFPHSQSLFMDDIFGKGAIKELFSPRNGLFLHTAIKKALELGLVAIVPDIDLEPKDPRMPLDDQQKRQDRVKQWENQPVNEFKFIVLDHEHKRVTEHRFGTLKVKVNSMAEIHGRKLKFRTTFRPRARYVWWTWMNCIIRNAWNQDSKDTNKVHVEVKNSTRYWGTRRSYVKRNQIRGFIEELGQDVASILEPGDDDEDDEDDEYKEPRFEVFGALLGDTMSSSEDSDKEEVDEDEDEDEDEDAS
ncbi:hypothetical protein ACHAPU_006980 [Fusarium lateritium]